MSTYARMQQSLAVKEALRQSHAALAGSIHSLDDLNRGEWANRLHAMMDELGEMMAQEEVNAARVEEEAA